VVFLVKLLVKFFLSSKFTKGFIFTSSVEFGFNFSMWCELVAAFASDGNIHNFEPHGGSGGENLYLDV